MVQVKNTLKGLEMIDSGDTVKVEGLDGTFFYYKNHKDLLESNYQKPDYRITEFMLQNPFFTVLIITVLVILIMRFLK
jgi:hypothetical protein